MIDPLIRIVLACYLAVWSPALCCCSVKQAIGGLTCTSVSDCHGFADVTTARVAEIPIVRSCCAQSSVDQVPAAKLLVSPEGPSSGAPGTPCRCHDATDAKIRLDTGVKVAVPALLPAHDWQAAPMVFIAAKTAPRAIMSRTVCNVWRVERERSAPVPSTLVARHTLLLI